MMEIIIICVAAAFFVGEVIMLIGGGINIFRERYFYNPGKKRYLGGGHRAVMGGWPPQWGFSPTVKKGGGKRGITRD